MATVRNCNQIIDSPIAPDDDGIPIAGLHSEAPVSVNNFAETSRRPAPVWPWMARNAGSRPADLVKPKRIETVGPLEPYRLLPRRNVIDIPCPLY